MATHFPLLSYHVDMSNWTFQEAQDVGFTKMYGRNCHPEWYQYPNFQGLAHGLHEVTTKRAQNVHHEPDTSRETATLITDVCNNRMIQRSPC